MYINIHVEIKCDAKQFAPVFHDQYIHALQTCFAANICREYATNSNCINKIFVAKRMISSFAYREQISCIRILTLQFISLHIYKIFL